MANKTEREKQNDASGSVNNQAAIAPRETLQMTELVTTSDVVPESFADIVQKHDLVTEQFAKLTKGKYIKGIFEGTADGELAARPNGEIPAVKWHMIRVNDQTVLRLLGAYSLTVQLANVKPGDQVIIGRGEDRRIGDVMVTDYIVYKPRTATALPSAPKDTSAKSAVVEAVKS